MNEERLEQRFEHISRTILGTLTPVMIKKTPESCEHLLEIVEGYYKGSGIPIPAKVKEKRRQINGVYIDRLIKSL